MNAMSAVELKEVGDTFKKRRQELNLSLKEVENATSIRISSLQAIEEGDLKKLISTVHAQGFVKQYANFLGIDGDAIIRENPDLYTKKESQEFAYGIGTLEMRGNPGGGVKWVPGALWIIAFGILFIAAYYIGKFFQLY